MLYSAAFFLAPPAKFCFYIPQGDYVLTKVRQLAIKADLAIPMFSPLINLLILIFEYMHVAVAFISQSQFQKTSLLKRVKN